MNRQILKPALLLPSALLAVLGVTSATAQEIPDAWPDWLKDAMQRETNRLPEQPVNLGEGAFTATLPARSLGEIAAIDDGWYITGDIGSDGVMECWIFESNVDPATLMSNITDVSMASTADANGPIQTETVYFLDMGMTGDLPTMALEWLYGVGEPPNMLLGLSKARVAWTSGGTLACGHNDLGFRDTFADAFAQFIGSAAFANAPAAPAYQEVYLQRIGDRKVGLSSATFALDADGDTEMRRLETSILPVDASTLNVSDSWTIAYTRPDDSLINQYLASTENGERTTELNLVRDEDGVWQVSGMLSGKEIAGALGADVEPQADIAQMRAAAALFDNEDTDSVSLAAWVPEADPLSFVDAAIELDRDAETAGAGTITLGPLKVDAVFDPSGSAREARMDLGGVTMLIERVWQRGELP